MLKEVKQARLEMSLLDFNSGAVIVKPSFDGISENLEFLEIFN